MVAETEDATALAPHQVVVRMYRRILGDCFLIRTIHDGRPWHALIDFGILQGSPGRRERHQAILDDLKATTGGRIDLLVCTHEHADHLSGFGAGWERFFGGADQQPDFEVGTIWMAWTEDADDPDGKVLQEGRLRALRAVRLADAAARTDHAIAATHEAGIVREFLRFVPGAYDAADEDGDGMALAGRMRVAEVMKGLAAKVPRGGFLSPGQTRAAGPLVAHVLGPPRATGRLSRSDPRAGAAREVYLATPEIAVPVEEEGGRLLRRAMDEGPVRAPAALLALATSQAAAASAPSRVFAVHHGVALDRDEPPTFEPAAGYFAPENAWRRIDRAWINAASELALKLDSDTNNTSLALAFSLPDGQVLLFPGDAQVGNWLSWADQDYPAAPPDGATTEDAPKLGIRQILSRVTLYKVAHHGSHNATLRDEGLELMTDPRLAAMVPVDREVASSQEWAMPFPMLLARLREKTGGRIVLGDGDMAEEATLFDASTHARVRHGRDGAWVEIVLPIGNPVSASG